MHPYSFRGNNTAIGAVSEIKETEFLSSIFIHEVEDLLIHCLCSNVIVCINLGITL